MNIATYVDSFARKKKFYDLNCDAKTVHNLLKGDNPYSLCKQLSYQESEYLAENIKLSVRGYVRDKDVAISIYKSFIAYLKVNDIEIPICFPPISISNSFERLMFIAKYLQDERHKISDLPDLLWVSERTISDDIKKLRGLDDDPIQICGKVFKIDDVERGRDVLHFSSTAHPLFLTPNLTQILVTLKGLKEMSSNPLYADYAHFAASDIWEQLSDYAKTRIHYVLSELLPEDLTWYESLRKDDDEYFYSERRCSVRDNVVLDCIKNGKAFFIEYKTADKVQLYKECVFVPGSYTGNSIDIETNGSNVTIELENIIRSTYTIEELM